MTKLLTVLRICAVVTLLMFPSPLRAEPAKKVMVLGIDGLDPKILTKYVEQGLLPNFKKLMDEGDFSTLETTMPPLSPVAWSTFITGLDPSGHGIFDFVHRDPYSKSPFLSMSKSSGASRTFPVGSWVIPLSGGKIELLRQGTAFWEILEEHGIPTTIFRMPANFPPTETPGKSFSGMGTPDILGTPGTFSFFTTDVPANVDDISGGDVFKVRVDRGEVYMLDDNRDRVSLSLQGPPNEFRRIPKKRQRSGGDEIEYDTPSMKSEFSVYLDPDENAAKFIVGDEEFVLQQGEWSDWTPVEFEAVPWLVSISATARFYLQEVRPDLKLYVTPLQINPDDPAMPISTPDDWSHELCEELGYFYTQELPEDTKALSGGIFTGEEFWEQTQFVLHERQKALDYFLENFDEGLLFFYFSSIDQNCHMLWRYVDPEHPGYDASEGLKDRMQVLYQQVDESMGKVLDAIDDDTTLIVMSDHGFSPFYWGVNLNSWLVEKGYVKLKNPARQGEFPFFVNVDWSRTTAYALGLNGLYVNLRGREKTGIVNEGPEYDELVARLEKDMLELIDPRNGNNAISLVVNTKRDFAGGDHLDVGPDMIVGYNYGYRSSWESPLGEFPREIFVDNDQAWSGDHSMDYRIVPGVLLTNRKIAIEDPALYDLTIAVLDEYGIAPLEAMIGEDCIAPADAGGAVAGLESSAGGE